MLFVERRHHETKLSSMPLVVTLVFGTLKKVCYYTTFKLTYKINVITMKSLEHQAKLVCNLSAGCLTKYTSHTQYPLQISNKFNDQKTLLP